MDFINIKSLFTFLLTMSLVFTVSTSHSKNMIVYKHVDKNGIIHYSSKKPAGKSYNILNVRCPECTEWRNSVNWSNTPLITNKFNLEIDSAARKHGLEPALIKAVIHAESAFKPEVVSSAGAQGLMQLMPLTQKTYNVNNPYDPLQNIHGGSAYLKHLKGVYNNIDVYLAAYNSGETAVEKYGRAIPPFPETREYVRRVKILYNRYQNSIKLNANNRPANSLSINAASR
ncbi:lytic transglycosylase domain-containing protein [Marinicella litoralis]|uniref:Transglycosylase-like protein with SLT domain n=1 Tax=Marinicella litoralis TaxID=644220 RepID=A0A4R6XG56_9GAMM|nr:lytic transglycosylase domain-containing protein [Marinicella litoralis]TDR18376.1 transglycosylase-like protein with SLT domain [Marinicella litoralis]